MNMKKLFPDEKGKKSIKEFLDKRGFYIVLLLCIAVVAGTAVYVTTRNATSEMPEYEARDITPYEEDGNDLAEGENLLNAQEPEDTQASVTGGESDIGSPASVDLTEGESAAKPEEDKKKDTTEPAKTPAKTAEPQKNTTPAKKQSFIMPVDGDVSLEFAKDTLVYSKTLEEWRAHTGVDLAADRGTPVKVVADGVVVDVRNDQYYGISIVVDHGDGIQTVYRNLASDDAVSVNEKVKQGQIVGSVGNTALDESSEQPHLHFEVLKDNVSVDPMTYLPKK